MSPYSEQRSGNDLVIEVARMQRFFMLIIFILSSAVAQGDQARVVVSDQEAVRIRHELIQQSIRGNKKEILLEYFEIGDDELTLSTLASLQRAARQNGVKVKILVDGLFNRLSKKVLAALVENTPSLEIRIYNPLTPRTLLKVTARTHDKLFIVDNEWMLIGSRNAAAGYYDEEERGQISFVDLDLLVQGSAVSKARRYFYELWESAEVYDLTLGDYSKKFLNSACNREKGPALCMDRRDKKKQSLKQMVQKLERLWTSPHTGKAVRWRNQMSPVENIDFLANETAYGVSRQHQLITDQIYKKIAKARTKLTIVTPYLYPSKESLNVLAKIAKRGVRVRILTNSRASTDSYLAQAGYEEIRDQLIEMGVELHEYKGPQVIHAKLAVIDDSKLIVGSYNFDIRSERINREVALSLSLQGDLRRDLERALDEFMEHSWQVSRGGRSVDPGNAYQQANDAKALQMFKAVLKLNLPGMRDQI